MATYDGLIFDGDNHDYEAEDAFMRYVPRRMQKRCVQWVEMDGKRRHLVAGKLNHAVGNMGADRVIYGSDWPHMEGLEHPRDIIEELDGIAAADLEKILYRNTAGLNERRPF